jgi:hypothetical protein
MEDQIPGVLKRKRRRDGFSGKDLRRTRRTRTQTSRRRERRRRGIMAVLCGEGLYLLTYLFR